MSRKRKKRPNACAEALTQIREKAGVTQAEVKGDLYIDLYEYETQGVLPKLFRVRRLLDYYGELAPDIILPEDKNRVLNRCFPREYPLPSELEIHRICKDWGYSIDNRSHPAYLIDCKTRILYWNDHLSQLIPSLDIKLLREDVPLISVFFDHRTRDVMRESIINHERFIISQIAVWYVFFERYENERWCQDFINEKIATHEELKAYWLSLKEMSYDDRIKLVEREREVVFDGSHLENRKSEIRYKIYRRPIKDGRFWSIVYEPVITS